MKPLVNLTMFRGYVNKILPTVYDDSLSYYEVLAKVMAKLNEVIELDNEQNEIINNLPLDVSSFAEDLAQFKADMTQQFNDYKEQMNASLDAFEDEINAKIVTDSAPTQGSTNLVTSGGVYAALKDITDSLIKDALPTQGSDDFVTSGGVYTAIQTAVNNINTVLATKQNTLTFDTTPTENSINPVQSGGIKTYVDTKTGNVQTNLDNYTTSNNARSATIEGNVTALETGKQNKLTFDQSPTLNSGNPVTSDGIARAIASVTPTIDIDDVPTEGSTNAVSSNGVYQAIETLTTDTEEALAEKQDELTFDLMPTQNSMNPVTSGGVWQKISEIDPYGTVDPEPTEGSTAAVQSGGTWSALQQLNSTLSAEIDTKQDGLTFDNSPTINSENPVTSDGIYRALQQKQSALTFDSTPTQYSTNPVTSGGVYDAIQQGGGGGGTIDPVPTEGSTNAVQSGGTWTALQRKQDTLTFDSVPTQYSTNPVTSGGVYDAIQQGGGGGGTIDPVPTEGSTNAVQSGGTWTALQGKADKSETAEYAIIGTTTGANPTITDSTNGNVQNLTIYGASRTSKNLAELENGTFETNGRKNANSYRVRTTKIISLPAGTYVISASSNNGTVNISYTTWQNSKTDGTNTIIFDSDWFTSPVTVTFDNSVYLSCVCKYANDSNIDASEITFQLEHGSTPTPYEPYFSGIHGIGEDEELEITTTNGDNTSTTTATITTGLPMYADGNIKDELNKEKGVVIKRCEKTTEQGEEIIVPLATPVEIPLSTSELTQLRNLHTYNATTIITVTDEPTIDVKYLLNTDNGNAVANVWAAIPSGSGITKTLLYDNNYDGVQDTLITAAGNLLTGSTYDEYEVEYILFDGSSTNDNLCYPTIIKFRPETIINLSTDYSGIFNVGIVTSCIYDAFAYFNVYEDTDLQDNPVTKFELDSGRSNIPTDMVININRIWGITY